MASSLSRSDVLAIVHARSGDTAAGTVSATVTRRPIAPNLRYNAGRTTRVSHVDVMRPPRITRAIGRTISRPAMSPRKTTGTKATAAGPALKRPRAEGFPFLLLDLLVTVDEQDPVPRRDPEEGQESHERPE